MAPHAKEARKAVTPSPALKGGPHLSAALSGSGGFCSGAASLPRTFVWGKGSSLTSQRFRKGSERDSPLSRISFFNLMEKTVLQMIWPSASETDSLSAGFKFLARGPFYFQSADAKRDPEPLFKEITCVRTSPRIRAPVGWL